MVTKCKKKLEEIVKEELLELDRMNIVEFKKDIKRNDTLRINEIDKEVLEELRGLYSLSERDMKIFAEAHKIRLRKLNR